MDWGRRGPPVSIFINFDSGLKGTMYWGRRGPPVSIFISFE
jgi:hypothetical protein